MGSVTSQSSPAGMARSRHLLRSRGRRLRTKRRCSSCLSTAFSSPTRLRSSPSAQECREVCPQLDIGLAARILASVDTARLTALSDELLDWLNRNLPAIDDRSQALLSALPIFPTATGSFAPLDTLSLPHAFHDPINVATLVDEAAARDYHKLLTTLGARPLDVVDYFRIHVIPAAVEQRLSPDQAVQILQLVAVHQVQLRDLRGGLAAAPLVPCLDGRLYPAREVHFPSPDIALLAPELPVAVTEGVAPAVLEWLGVPKAPTNAALAIAVQRLALGPANPDPAVAEAVLRTLAARHDTPDSPPEFLTSQKWLPLRARRKGGTERGLADERSPPVRHSGERTGSRRPRASAVLLATPLARHAW